MELTSAAPSSSRPVSPRKVLLALALFVFIAYGWTLAHPFAFDDSHTIQLNPAVQTSHDLLRLWTSASYYSVTPDNWGYRPLVTFMNAIAWLMGDGSTWPFHLQKKIMMVFNCFLLFLVWKRLWSAPGFFPEPAPRLGIRWHGRVRSWILDPEKAAIALAFVFAIHPANNQVFNYISASSTLFSGTLFLLAYYLYLRYRDDGGVKLLALSAVAYAFSVLAKEEGITLLAVVALTEIFVPRRATDRPNAGGRLGGRVLPLLVYLAIAIAMAALLKLMFAETSNLGRGNLNRWSYFMTQWRAYLHYMALLVWPWDLNADNLEFGFSSSIWDAKVLAALAGNLILLTFAWFHRKSRPVLLFSLLWFYVTISPASSIIPLAEPVNDHRMYLSYFGLVGAVFPAFLKLLEWAFPGGASGVAAAAVFVALNVGAQARNWVWSTPERLWADTVAKNPHSGRAKNNLALVYMGRADWDKALKLLNDCERDAPTYSVCQTNLGQVYAAIGRDAEAEQKYKQAMIFAPYNTMNLIYYGDFLYRRGMFREAIEVFKSIDRITSGGNLQAKINWAQAAREIGRYDEARSVLDEAKKRFPGHPSLVSALRQERHS